MFIAFTDWKKGHSYQPLARHRRDVLIDTKYMENAEEYISPSEKEMLINDQFLQITSEDEEMDQPSTLYNFEYVDNEIRDSGLIYSDKDLKRAHLFDFLERNARSVERNERDINPGGIQDDVADESISSLRKAVPIHEILLGERRPFSEEPFPPGTSITRRKRWLEKYMQDIESGELEKGLLEKHEELQQRRRKRSTASGVEGQSFTNVRLQIFRLFYIVYYL